MIRPDPAILARRPGGLGWGWRCGTVASVNDAGVIVAIASVGVALLGVLTPLLLSIRSDVKALRGEVAALRADVTAIDRIHARRQTGVYP